MNIPVFKTADRSIPIPAVKTANGVTYLSFPALSELKDFRHMVSTRLGGVSSEEFSSMNLSYTRGDNPDNVLENFRRISEVMHCTPDDIVTTYQTHTKNIRIVTSEDRGYGVTRGKPYKDVDGLITNESGIVLGAYFADCVPILLADPETKSAGIVHSGWRGTNLGICKAAIEAMTLNFGTDPKDVRAAIGPSICKGCYEVSEDLLDAFTIEYSTHTKLRNVKLVENYSSIATTPALFYSKGNGKYQLDLWAAVEETLLSAGISENHIETTNVCTCCNPDLLFSHRATGGKRGNLCAFIGII